MCYRLLGGKALTLKHEGKPFELAPGLPVVQKSSVSGEFPPVTPTAAANRPVR